MSRVNFPLNSFAGQFAMEVHCKIIQSVISHTIESNIEFIRVGQSMTKHPSKMKMHTIAFFSMLVVFSVLCYPFVGATCQSISPKVCGICLFYNQTADGDYLSHIDRNTVIFHFIPLFVADCSPLSRILDCGTFFPFCSPHLPVRLPPCQQVCSSVYAACHHIFTAHHQPWPAILNCTELPSPPSLCLLPSSYIHHHHPPSNHSNTSSLSSTQSSFAITKSSSPAQNFTISHSTSVSTSVSLTSSPSSASFIATIGFVALAPPLLVIFVLGFFFLHHVFCFHTAPLIDNTYAITYTSLTISSSPPPSPSHPAQLSLTSLPPDVPPPSPPPPLPLKKKNLPTAPIYQNTGHTTLYAISELY